MLSRTLYRYLSFPEPVVAATGIVIAAAIVYIMCIGIVLAAKSKKKYGLLYIIAAVIGCSILYIYLEPSCTEYIKPRLAVLDDACIRITYNNSRIDFDCNNYLRLDAYNDTHYTACNEICKTEITTRSETPGIRYKIPAVICTEQCHTIEFLTKVNWLYNTLIGIVIFTVSIAFVSVA